ncbi:hypothetical protein V2J09_013809 [Rumex salicifolius]
MKSGRVADTEVMFNKMKASVGKPDVVAYTTMIHTYSVDENWEKALELFQEMEANSIQPDVVACSALMRAFNRGCQPTMVLELVEYMKEKKIPISDVMYYEILSACSMLRDWKVATELLIVMEPSLHEISVGLLNQLLQLLGKSGKIGNMMRVLQWMEDSGVQPTFEMYQNIVFYAERSSGPEHADIIRQRLDSLKCFPENLFLRNKLDPMKSIKPRRENPTIYSTRE